MRAIQKITILMMPSLLVIFTRCSVSSADEPPKPELIKMAGQPVLLKYSDGREAIMKVTSNQIENVGIPFAITENTCNQKLATGCKYYVPSVSNSFFFAWSKHPDPSKIERQIISPGSSDDSDDKLEFASSYSSLNRSQFPNASALKSIPNQYIVCPKLDWFEPNESTIENGRRVRAISNELALRNDETGVDENRFFSTARDVKFNQVSNTTLEIESALLPKSTALTIPFLFFGDAAWYVKSNSGEVCQFTSRAKFADAVADFSAATKNMTKPEEEKHIYIYGDSDADLLNQLDRNLESRIMQRAATAK